MARLPDRDIEHVLLRADAAWQTLRGARVFITGGTGFFGTWLLESISRANAAHGLGCEVLVLSRDPGRFLTCRPHLASDRSIRWLRGDVRSFPFPAGAFTHVIHGATDTTTGNRALAQLLETIVIGTRRVLSLASACGAERVLLVSSGAVYGPQPPGLLNVGEDYEGAPPLRATAASIYGEAKRVAELLCLAESREKQQSVTIARGFAFVGPHLPLDAHFAIGNFIRDGLAGRPIVVSGDGTPYRSYLHSADLSVWLWTILCSGQDGRAYNVGSEHAVSIADLARRVGKRCSVDVRIRRDADSNAPAQRYVPSTRRARDELGLTQYIDLDEAICRTLSWCAEQTTRRP